MAHHARLGECSRMSPGAPSVTDCRHTEPRRVDSPKTVCHDRRMPRAARRGIVAFLVVVVSAVACGVASSGPSQTTSAPPAGKKYISKRDGYSIVLKGKYVLVPAKLQWDGRFPFGATGMVDL